VHDIGLASINDFYFATGHYKYDGGFMATASHNPPQYGGFKMTYNNTEYTNSIQFISGKQILKEMEAGTNLVAAKKSAKLKNKDISKDHLKHLFSFVDLKKIQALKVVVDTGSGMVGLLLPKIFEKLPCDFIHLFPDLDPKFSSRPPNPLAPDASKEIAKKIKESQADLGIMFDADGDRMFLLDEEGKMIKGDQTLLLLAKTMLAKHPESGIVYNLICSHAVPELVSKWGGKPIRSEVGYVNLARHMHQEFGIMSGEVSGHFAWRDNFYADSGLVAMLVALQTISEDGRKLSEIVKDFQLYFRADEYNVPVTNLESSLDKIRYNFRDQIRDEIDGITVEFSDWWFNIRPSNTEPLVRITVEAKDEAEVKKHQNEILEIIKN
jgi:phosphomannomutase